MNNQFLCNIKFFCLAPTPFIASPDGTLVSGSTNTYDYPRSSSVTLTCTLDPPPLTFVQYRWNTTRCYTNTNFNNGRPRCFPRNQITRSVADSAVTEEDAGTITCTVIIDGKEYTSGPFTLRISGELVYHNTYVHM